MAVISIIENCQNLVKLKLPEPDRESQIDFYIFEALSVLPKLEYLWIKLDENIDIEAEEILIAVLPHLIINPEWIQTPAIKGGLNSEGIFTLVQSSKNVRTHCHTMLLITSQQPILNLRMYKS